MKELIRHILKEDILDIKERFIRSAKSIPYIIQSNVDSDIITEVDIENVDYNDRVQTISGELLITSWCEDPDLFEFTSQLKWVDKEIEKVLLNYTFSSNGFFGEKKGKYNNMMFWFIGCEWSAESNFILKMKYQFIQEEYNDGE